MSGIKEKLGILGVISSIVSMYGVGDIITEDEANAVFEKARVLKSYYDLDYLNVETGNGLREIIEKLLEEFMEEDNMEVSKYVN